MTGLPAQFLYAAMQIRTVFVDDVDQRLTKCGTAFFVRHPTEPEVCLVTNRHLIQAFYKFPSDLMQERRFSNYKIEYIDVIGRFSGDNLQTFRSIHGHYDIVFPDNECHDIAVIKFRKIITEIMTDAPIKIDNVFTYDTLAQSHEFGDKILVCDIVAFPSYSEWVSEKEMRPTFRVGWVVSDPRHGIDLPEVKGDAMLIEGFSTSGSSGAPVIALEKGIRTGSGLQGGSFRPFRLVGVNAGHLRAKDYLHANLSYIFKSTVIDECIKKAI
ncbi:hypothetical protein [Elioraea sp.]|uniref:hypothetical protein n=1 Tax=Elioraea sp. TaxID=2185103 RepID=UPI003F702CB3